MTDDVPDLRGGSAKTVLAILTPILGALGLFGGFVWQASRYPDRPEFEDAKRESRAALSEYAKRLAAIEKDVAVSATKIDAIQQSQVRIESKLEKRRP